MVVCQHVYYLWRLSRSSLNEYYALEWYFMFEYSIGHISFKCGLQRLIDDTRVRTLTYGEDAQLFGFYQCIGC